MYTINTTKQNLDHEIDNVPLICVLNLKVRRKIVTLYLPITKRTLNRD